MRPIHLLLGLVVILGSGASAFVATRLASTPEPVRLEPVAAATPVLRDESAAIRARAAEDKLAMLGAQLDDMRAELESLRNSANRAPASVASQPVATPAAVGSVQVTEEQRQTVLAVLAEDRARQAAEAEAKRVEAEQEAARRRAARVAKDLSLSPGDEARLADMMFEGNKKRQEMFESVRTGNFDRDTMRTQMESFRTWQTDQLTVAFGASIAEQIIQAEGDRLGFGGPGGPGGGNNNGNGGNGGGGGRGARRANAAGGAGQTGLPGGGGGGN